MQDGQNIQPKFAIQPKRVAKMNLRDNRPNVGPFPREIQLCPLELRPLLNKSSSSVEINCTNYLDAEDNRRTRIPRRIRQDCNDENRGKGDKTTDVYRNILGPTPDESILAGLQTVIDLCGLIDTCADDDSEFTHTTDTGSYQLCPNARNVSNQQTKRPGSLQNPPGIVNSRPSLYSFTDDAEETFRTAHESSSKRSLLYPLQISRSRDNFALERSVGETIGKKKPDDQRMYSKFRSKQKQHYEEYPPSSERRSAYTTKTRQKGSYGIFQSNFTTAREDRQDDVQSLNLLSSLQSRNRQQKEFLSGFNNHNTFVIAMQESEKKRNQNTCCPSGKKRKNNDLKVNNLPSCDICPSCTESVHQFKDTDQNVYPESSANVRSTSRSREISSNRRTSEKKSSSGQGCCSPGNKRKKNEEEHTASCTCCTCMENEHKDEDTYSRPQQTGEEKSSGEQGSCPSGSKNKKKDEKEKDVPSCDICPTCLESENGDEEIGRSLTSHRSRSKSIREESSKRTSNKQTSEKKSSSGQSCCPSGHKHKKKGQKEEPVPSCSLCPTCLESQNNGEDIRPSLTSNRSGSRSARAENISNSCPSSRKNKQEDEEYPPCVSQSRTLKDETRPRKIKSDKESGYCPSQSKRKSTAAGDDQCPGYIETCNRREKNRSRSMATAYDKESSSKSMSKPKSESLRKQKSSSQRDQSASTCDICPTCLEETGNESRSNIKDASDKKINKSCCSSGKDKSDRKSEKYTPSNDVCPNEEEICPKSSARIRSRSRSINREPSSKDKQKSRACCSVGNKRKSTRERDQSQSACDICPTCIQETTGEEGDVCPNDVSKTSALQTDKKRSDKKSTCYTCGSKKKDIAGKSSRSHSSNLRDTCPREYGNVYSTASKIDKDVSTMSEIRPGTASTVEGSKMSSKVPLNAEASELRRISFHPQTTDACTMSLSTDDCNKCQECVASKEESCMTDMYTYTTDCDKCPKCVAKLTRTEARNPSALTSFHGKHENQSRSREFSTTKESNTQSDYLTDCAKCPECISKSNRTEGRNASSQEIINEPSMAASIYHTPERDCDRCPECVAKLMTAGSKIDTLTSYHSQHINEIRNKEETCMKSFHSERDDFCDKCPACISLLDKVCPHCIRSTGGQVKSALVDTDAVTNGVQDTPVYGSRADYNRDMSSQSEEIYPLKSGHISGVQTSQLSHPTSVAAAPGHFSGVQISQLSPPTSVTAGSSHFSGAPVRSQVSEIDDKGVSLARSRNSYGRQTGSDVIGTQKKTEIDDTYRQSFMSARPKSEIERDKLSSTIPKNETGGYVPAMQAIEEEDIGRRSSTTTGGKRVYGIQTVFPETETSSYVESSDSLQQQLSKSSRKVQRSNIDAGGQDLETEEMYYDYSPLTTDSTKSGNDVSLKSTLSTKCFPPVEIPPSRFSIGTRVDSECFSECADSLNVGGGDIREPPPIDRNRSSQRTVPLTVPKSRASSFTCNKDITPERKRKEIRCSRGSLPPAVQPVVGVCTDGKCGSGDRVLDVRYATVKISVFEDYTTYEIMKSSPVKPKKIPDCVEGIFVTKR